MRSLPHVDAAPDARRVAARVVALVALVALSASPSLALAQEPGGAVEIPSVDAIDAQHALEAAPEARLVELTLGLYERVEAWDGACDAMWRPVRGYLDSHGEAIEAAAALIAERAAQMTPDELQALGAFFGAELVGHPTARAAQDKLYVCLRSAVVQGKGRPLEKEMRRFFRLQKPMIDAIIGPVD